MHRPIDWGGPSAGHGRNCNGLCPLTQENSEPLRRAHRHRSPPVMTAAPMPRFLIRAEHRRRDNLGSRRAPRTRRNPRAVRTDQRAALDPDHRLSAIRRNGTGTSRTRMQIRAKVAEEAGQERQARGADFKKEHEPFLFVTCRRS